MPKPTLSFGATIRSGAKYISWATAAWAPVSTAYAAIAGGQLKFAHIYTTLGIQQVLLNLSWATGQLLWWSIFLYFMACVVIGIPLSIVESLFKLDRERIDGVAANCALGIGFCAGLFVLWRANPDPLGTVRSFGDLQTSDQWLTGLGGVSLAVIYLGIFLSIKRVLAEGKER